MTGLANGLGGRTILYTHNIVFAYEVLLLQKAAELFDRIFGYIECSTNLAVIQEALNANIVLARLKINDSLRGGESKTFTFLEGCDLGVGGRTHGEDAATSLHSLGTVAG